MKICKKCNLEKSILDFHKDKGLNDGLRKICKSCAIACAKISQTENKIKRHFYFQNYMKSNQAKLKKHRQEYYQRTKDNSRKEYISKNKIKIRARNRVYEKTKRSENIDWKIRSNLRNRINRAVKFGYKKSSAVKELGCTIEFFKTYIEAKFNPGMSWANWSRYGWHLDHIIPLNCFDLNNSDDFKKAVHFTNFQPLWWKENLSKGKLLERPDKERVG